jgi:hypothetical protein
MGRSKKELHYGSRSGDGKILRRSVEDRDSKSARPWNEPKVVEASQSYGVPFASYKQVHTYENRLEDLGSVEPHERFTCKPCGKLNESCACKGAENG